MPDKHSTNGQRTGESEPNQGIIVPLDLPEFTILSQSMGADESIEVHVRAREESQTCPRCGKASGKVHDTRLPSEKRYPASRISGLFGTAQTTISVCDVWETVHGNG